jgi:hypothetical protein
MLCAAVTLLGLVGCESTVDLARKIAAKGIVAFQQHGLTVAKVDKHIRVLGTAIIRDASGTAVVVELRDSSDKPTGNAPIAIDVSDRAGKSVFSNDAPGLAVSLTHVPLLLPGQVFDWINDQVLATGTPALVVARIGAGSRVPASVPSMQVSGARSIDDPVSGYEVTGKVRNASGVTQVNLVLYAIARHSGRIVAAGRAIVPRLAAGKSAPFHAYVIGNPDGAQIFVTAPPSVLR